MLQILRKLKHENIIEMLDSFESPQEFCVVTEFAQVIGLLSLFLFPSNVRPQSHLDFLNVYIHRDVLDFYRY